MNVRRALAVVVLIAGVVAFFLLRHSGLRENTSTGSARITEAANRPPAKTATPFDATTHAASRADLAAGQRPSAPSRAFVASDPESAARAWFARASSVIVAKERREFGDEVTQLMHLPIAQAWDPLIERANNGDVAAAAAAMNIASLCDAESTRGNASSRNPPRPASSYFRDLPAAWKPFVDRVGAEFRDAHDARVEGCTGIGNVIDTAMLFFDQFIRPGNVEAEIEVAADNEDKRAAIGDLREIVAEHDTARGRTLLGDLLIESRDPKEHAEGLAMLEALAGTDPFVATRIGSCLAEGCGGAAKDPNSARAWLEQAAGLGESIAYARLGKDLAANGENAAAWAWSLYWLDLALDGCLETIAPMYFTIASAAQDEAGRKAVLSPAEQNAGLAMSYAIAGRWEKKAKERLSCAD